MGALNIDKSSKQRIYAIANRLGMVEQNNKHDDALHILVHGLTGKESISALTSTEAQLVEQELKRRATAADPTIPNQHKRKRKYEELPGGVTAKQQKYAWFLMSEIERFDPSPVGVRLRDRLCGIIEKQFKVTAFPSQPFRFVTMEQGGALIEGLKSMAMRTELKHLHSPKAQVNKTP